ncbi:hypothetical protein [Proteiniphilum sp.]|uniref:ankyrin repeat domain-containing protein n=1 Tax=Proteiniphilum sp. TaxID=1926877 RepID=UPI002B1FCA1E|nr:hypothetical protein [Proteiniphilum sp.]MEA4918695.1 hypothetical protein [Proteiniphilum sp.]
MKNYESAVLEAHNAVLASRGRVKELIENQKEIALEAMRACEIFPQFTGDNEEQFDETLVPYFFLIKRIKENPDKTIKEIVGIEEMENIPAALAAFEEYDLMERYIAEGNSFNVLTSVGAFRNWQPTPIYYVTITKVFENLRDAKKLLSFLVKYKADPNMFAGDESIPLLNACYDDKPIELLQWLLELGADPNKQGVERGMLWHPLSLCLLFSEGENEEESNPPSRESILKAKLLLEYGADPNKGLNDFPPLMLAIATCDHRDIDLIWDLLKRDANPNVLGDRYTLNPLLLSYDFDWFEAGQLLLLYGARMDTVQKLLKKRNNRHIIALNATTTLSFPSGDGADSTISKTFPFEKLEKCEYYSCNYFQITIKEKTNQHIEGSVFWQDISASSSPFFNCGKFNLSLDNPEYNTESLNISYETYTQLSLSLELSDISLKEEIK